MAKATQINLNYLWASTGSITDPDGGGTPGVNYEEGWQAEIPTLQEFNFVLNNADNNLLYIAENGAFEYEAAISYDSGAMVNYGGNTYYSKLDSNVGVTPGTNTNNWVRGRSYGNVGMDTYVNQQGLLIANVGDYTSTSLWQGSDITIKAALPIIAFESTGATDNWLLGNIEGEMCVANVEAVAIANNSSIVKSDADTHRLFHEGHPPIQSEVNGTIPDAASNGSKYVRQDGAWVVETPQAADSAGDTKFSLSSTMTSRGYLLKNGREFNRATYAGLFSEIGVSYGEGNTTTTANLPRSYIRSYVRKPTYPGSGIKGMAYNPNTDVLWACSSTVVYKLEGGSWSSVGTYPGTVATGLAIDISNNNVYVIDFSTNEVYLLTGGTGTWSTVSPSPPEASWLDIAVDGSNSDIFLVKSSGTSNMARLTSGTWSTYSGTGWHHIDVNDVTSEIYVTDSNDLYYNNGASAGGGGYSSLGSYQGNAGSAGSIAIDSFDGEVAMLDSNDTRRPYIIPKGSSSFTDLGVPPGEDGALAAYDVNSGALWMISWTNKDTFVLQTEEYIKT